MTGEYEFTLVIEGDLADEDTIVRLAKAGCDDATFSGERGGVGIGEFIREADSLLDAIAGAIGAVESVPGLRVRRVEPDDLVTIPEIAERLDRSVESIRLLANGQRGGGSFPAPVSHLRTRNRLWRWSDVAEWAGLLEPDDLHNAHVLAAFNAGLELRQLMGVLDPSVINAIGQSLGVQPAA